MIPFIFKENMLNLAMQGKLNTQDFNDESASILLNNILTIRKKWVKDKKIKKNNNESFIIQKDTHYYERVGKNGEEVCIDDEIPFEIPNNWIWCTLGNIVSVKGGKRVPKGYKLLDEPTSHIYIRVTNMKNGTIIKEDLKYIDDEVYESIKNYTISKDDLYITVAGTIGRIGSVPDHFDRMNLTENANKITDITINKEYLKYLLMSNVVQSQLIDKTTQVAQPKLAIKRILSVKIPLPPLKEQQRIVNILNLVDKYVSYDIKLHELNVTFGNDFKKVILQEAVQGKLVPQDPNNEPAYVLLENIKQENAKLIKAKKIKKNNKESVIFKESGHYYEKVGKKEPVCIDDEIPFEIPDNWEWCRMGAFNEIARGGSPRPIKQYITDDPNGINWIKIGDTIKGEKYIYSTKEKIKPEGMKKSRYVEEGDFLLTNSMSFGRPYIMKTNGCIHDGWLVIKLNKDLFYQDFMFFLLSSNFIFKEFTRLSAGSTVKNLKIDSVKKVLVPIPPLNEQKRIVDKVEQLFECVDVLIDE